LKSTDDYRVVSIPYTPYQYVTSAPALFYVGCPDDQDDKFFDTTFLPFKFCFFGSQYAKLAISTNGVITFDSTNALKGSNWALGASSAIPYIGSGAQGTGTCPIPGDTLLPRAAIFGAYYDLDINGDNFPNKKMEVRVEGTAPCRRFIVSYFEIPLYSCTSVAGTQQIVLHESTGLIDVFIGNKPTCTWNSNNGILGIQNWDRNYAVTAPNKNSTPWSESNTAYQFVPSGGASRFVRIQVLNMAGTVLATGDTTTRTAGLLDVTFPTLCNTGATTQYVVKTVFSGCIAGEELISLDTITVNRTNSLEAAASGVTQTDCGINGTGSVTVNVPAGIGTAPYTFTINPGGTSQTAAPGTSFNNLTAGNYTINVVDASTNCVSTVPVTIESTGVLLITLDQLPTSCAGATNGVINITASNALPPLQYSLNGGAWTSGSSIPNLPAGTHFVSVRDAGGCEAIFVPITVDEGASNVSGSAAPAPTSCTGVNDGTLTVTPGGTGPFEYSINGGTNWQTSATFTGLAPGTYNVIIRAGGMCLSNAIPVTVTAGGGLTGTLTPTPTTCPGVNNGSIQVTATSGTGPYTFRLDGTVIQTGNPGTTFNGVSAGPHTVTITAANGCTTTTALTTTVTSGTGFTANSAPSPTTCFGVNNGSVTITPQLPAVSPYTFVLTPGNISQTGATNTTYNGLAPGTYSVRVTDAAGCQATVNNITIAQGNGLTGNVTTTSTACVGVNTGTVVVNATSGTGPYTFVMDGTVTQTGAAGTTFTGVAAGSHTVTIRDVNGCQTTTALTGNVAAGTGFTATPTQIAVSCLGATNGSVTITPQAPGTGPYTFLLTPGSVSQNGATATTYNGLGAGTYSVLVTDANGCQTTVSNITLAAGAGLTATLTPSPATCTGATNGSLQVTATNGTGPYTFILDASVTQTGNPTTTFTSLASGTHNITITDANGCRTSASLSTIIIAGTGFTADFTSAPTACVGVNNGGITITPRAPGTGPYTFVLTPGTITQTGTTFTSFTGLAPGTYGATVTDANGCQTSLANMVVIQGSGIQATITPANVACFGTATGNILVTPSNGTGPYTFNLTGAATAIQTGASNTTFANLGAGNYNISITDAAGCVTSAVLTQSLTQPTALSAPAPAALPVTCNGGTNGQISVSPAGGTAPYTYSLNAGPFQPTNSFNVGQGNYTIRVRDSRGCEISFPNIVVTQPAPLAGSILTTTNATCAGGADGTIQVAASGGTTPYQYSTTTTYQPSSTLNVIPGNYTVTVRDANNCTASIPGVVVGLTDNLTLAIDPSQPVCEGRSIKLNVNSNASSYVWDAAAGLSTLTTEDPSVSPTAPTTYTVHATLGNCSRAASVNVDVLPAPVADAGAPGDICFGHDYQLGGSGGVGYSWAPTLYLDDPNSPAPNVIQPAPGITTYSLSVTGANGCTSLIPSKVVVKVTPPLSIKVTPVDTIVHAGAVFNLLAVSGGTYYEWTPPTGLNNPTIPNPTVTASATVGDVMIYQVVASSSAGCESLPATVTIKVYKGPEIYVPTAFSPNNDGRNEVFYPVPVGIKKLNYFRVFNRWGQLIFATTTFNHGWDGKMGGKEQGSDVYVWMVEGITETGQVITKQGIVTLVR
jgi:gliding motility-associated-like protein